MDWMPSCELPARRMTALRSVVEDDAGGTVAVDMVRQDQRRWLSALITNPDAAMNPPRTSRQRLRTSSKNYLDSPTYADELSGAGGYLYNGLMDNLNVPPPHPF
jgi:hypothetical protein